MEDLRYIQSLVDQSSSSDGESSDDSSSSSDDERIMDNGSGPNDHGYRNVGGGSGGA